MWKILGYFVFIRLNQWEGRVVDRFFKILLSISSVLKYWAEIFKIYFLNLIQDSVQKWFEIYFDGVFLFLLLKKLEHR